MRNRRDSISVRHDGRCGLLAAIVLVTLSVSYLGAPGGLGAQQSDAQVKARVEALLAKMTLEEKIGQLNQAPGIPFQGAPPPDERIAQGRVGSVLWVFNPQDINRFQRIAVEKSRLHIPLLIGLDVIQGYQTIFPDPLGMAATWDPKLVEQEQAVSAKEARSAGITWTFAPMVDIARDARWAASSKAREKILT